ncbi:hypothetical protein ACSS6W_008843 [Trichoderma asperelloides]|uniref:Uncharacterized protein YEL023C n=1 Tax=Trichoderma asperellum TaxID=101201 RepID=A0A6V8QTS3_TRIAP|nr:uncharacterized protein YEL023C [Trichoderma asperellum]
MSETVKPMPKRIIICCDGTWQSAVSGEKNSPSNVTRLARCLNRVAVEDDGKTWQQIVWYDSGVGTTSSWLGKKREGAIGAGLEGNVIEAYNFVALNWSPGDQVLCFGFSRGAYTARSIAGLISDIGICEPRKLQDFHEIWELYKANKSGKRFHGSQAWFDYLDGIPADDKDQPDDLGYRNMNFVWKKAPRGDWAISPESREIEVVGVFDTVGALGLPDVQGFKLEWGSDKYGFHNVKLNPNIKRAYHALALDEHREAFSPTLWYLPEHIDITEEDLEKKEKEVEEAQNNWYPVAYDKKTPLGERQRLKTIYNDARRDLCRMREYSKGQSELLQVWFPGVHINIGGGSSDTLKNEGDLEEMANITFAWMLDQISPYVSINETVVYQDSRARQKLIDDLNEQQRKYEELNKSKKDEAKRSWAKWANQTLSNTASALLHPLSKPKNPNENRHDFGWGTGTIVDSYIMMYWPNGSKPRTPKAYENDKKHTVSGETNEEIHPTVGYRHLCFEKLGEEFQYTPMGLGRGKNKGLVYARRQNSEGKFEYQLDNVVLPEYVMPAKNKKGGVSFERFALALAWEKTEEYIRDLDKGNGIPHEDIPLKHEYIPPSHEDIPL